MRLDVTLTPAEFPLLERRDLGGVACVVLDILRATSTQVTAFARGAAAIRPVASIAEAVAVRAAHPDILLAGEREGLRIRAAQSGGVDFDLGNSPREFTADRVAGRSIVMTTTNGTRAFRACAHARWVAAGSFLNLTAVAAAARATDLPEILLVCSGTGEALALEDAAAAGALIELLADRAALSDAAHLAREAWRAWKSSGSSGEDPERFLQGANGRRLIRQTDLAGDVAFCRQRDAFDVVPILSPEGELRLR